MSSASDQNSKNNIIDTYLTILIFDSMKKKPKSARAGPSTEPSTSAHTGPSTEPPTSAPRKDLTYKKLGLKLTRLGLNDGKVIDLLNNLEKLSAYYKFTHDKDEFIISDVYERIKEKQEFNKQGTVKVTRMNEEMQKIINFNDESIEKTKEKRKKEREERLEQKKRKEIQREERSKRKKEKEPVKETEQPEMQLELHTPPPEPEEPEEEPEEVPVTHLGSPEHEYREDFLTTKRYIIL